MVSRPPRSAVARRVRRPSVFITCSAISPMRAVLPSPVSPYTSTLRRRRANEAAVVGSVGAVAGVAVVIGRGGPVGAAIGCAIGLRHPLDHINDADPPEVPECRENLGS